MIPADTSASLLLQRVRSDDPQIHMPPAGEGERLTVQQWELLEQWISSGAAVPPAEAIPASP
ncbi:MAG: hypothetical protein ACKPJJ_07415, partial [Planctomycetaceae bacterium]